MASEPPVHQRSGQWLPKERSKIQQWLRKTLQEAPKIDEGLNPSLKRFEEVVEKENLTQMANDMFGEASAKYPTDPTGNSAIRNFSEMLTVMNLIMTQGPQFYDVSEPQTAMGLIGFPINAILNWPMGTPSGFQFFLLPSINAALKDVLQAWGMFLGTPASQQCLEGWLSQDAQDMLAAEANNGITDLTFLELYQVPNRALPLYGFQTWDEFFTRKFQDGVRPIDAPDDAPMKSISPNTSAPDPTAIITNACESVPLALKDKVKLHDHFLLKSQPYSLTNMLNFSPLAHQFVGGTIYQAYLTALSYHRWHAPVSGIVQKMENVDGTYYSESWFEGISGNPTKPDATASTNSQPYISAVATRSIIYIQARNPRIGLMAIVFIGMAEVSSCEFTVAEGQAITKGQEIGMFHYGGSSHCLLFRPGVNIHFDHEPPYDIDKEPNLRVRSRLAIVT